MKQKLNIKERRFLDKYLQGKPLWDCAKYAGSQGKDKASLTTIGHLMLRNLDISMEETLILNGVTDQLLTEKVIEGMKSTQCYRGTWRGGLVESKPFPDTSNRLKAVELAGRMKGVFIDRHELTGKDGGDIILLINPSSKSKQGKESVKMELD